MSPEVMAEYLVRLSADVDTGSFNSAMTAINQLSSKLKQMKGIAAAVALGGALTKIGTAAVGAIKDVARADMEFEKLGRRMWITKDNAKALSVAMKTMGCTEEDIAWVPELREQFFRLRNEMQELSTPQDAEDGLKFVRNIGYEIQSVQVKLKMLKEWVVYYLIKIIRPFMEEFREWVKWLSEKLKGRMPDIAKTIAKWLGNIVSLAATAMKVIRKIGESIYNFFEKMPESAKRWGAILAGVGAFVMASPLGKLLVVLGGALMLLEDFIYYCNGWNSSKALAPVWQTILDFLESDTLKNIKETALELVGAVGDGLDWISGIIGEIVRNISEGIDWEGMFETWNTGVGTLLDGVKDLYEELSKLFKDFAEWTGIKALSSQKAFWKGVGEVISDSIKNLMKFAGVIGKVFKAVACALRGDFSGAFSAVKDAVSGIADIATNNIFSKIVGGMASKMTDEERAEDGGVYEVAIAENDALRAAGITNIKTEWLAAQAAHESGWGESALSAKYHNYGGHKWNGEGEYATMRTRELDASGNEYYEDAKFQVFNSAAESGYHSAKWLLRNIPKEELQSITSAWELAAALRRHGYYTDTLENYGTALTQTSNAIAPTVDRIESRIAREAETAKKGIQKYSPNFDNGRTKYGMFEVQKPTDWITTGAQNAASACSFGGAFAATSAPSQVSYGDINVNVNVAGTNASANDIANATAKKIVGARMNKGVLV